jgi:signal peptidase I
LTAGAAALAMGLVAWRQRRSYLVVTVHGPSMSPTYSDGDRLLVRRVDLAAVGPDSVVVLAMHSAATTEAAELIIKRIAALPGDPVPDGIPVSERLVPPGQLVVLGDNQYASYDSRRAGYFDATTLVGVVVRAMSQALA